ncbi:histidine phosphatase family protein [Brevundimonas sp.]|uniref:histidine phosphatase family protein n=1 Tax=Brevundimonas sp. TaxID=1871086 RepID=UPI002898FF82|nr:histidine phosphatase family protein [Brevundimonas sp.]
MSLDTPHITRLGDIVLARHGKPALSRKCWLTAQQYRDWWGRYDAGGLLEGQAVPPGIMQTAREAGTIYASTLRRAQETAAAVSQGQPVHTHAVFVEAPLPPPHWPDWFKMPPRLWGVVARLWWHVFNHHDGQESRLEAEARAGRAADMLIERALAGQDVLVLAHGYFNHMIGQQLKARGWKLVDDQGFKYWCQRRFRRA